MEYFKSMINEETGELSLENILQFPHETYEDIEFWRFLANKITLSFVGKFYVYVSDFSISKLLVLSLRDETLNDYILDRTLESILARNGYFLYSMIKMIISLRNYKYCVYNPNKDNEYNNSIYTRLYSLLLLVGDQNVYRA